MAIWAFAYDQTSCDPITNAGCKTHQITCAGSGPSCEPTMILFFVYFLVVGVFSYIKTKGLCEQGVLAGVARLDVEIIQDFVYKTILIMVVAFLSADIAADIPIQIMEQESNYWILALTLPVLIYVPVIIFHVYQGVAVWCSQKRSRSKGFKGLVRIVYKQLGEMSVSMLVKSSEYEGYSGVLTMMSVAVYVAGSIATGNYRFKDPYVMNEACQYPCCETNETFMNASEYVANYTGYKCLEPGEYESYVCAFARCEVYNMVAEKCAVWSDDTINQIDEIQDFLTISLRLDFIVRLLADGDHVQYFFDFQTLCDFFSISNLPAWLLSIKYKYAANSFGFLKFLRIMRAINQPSTVSFLGVARHRLTNVLVSMAAVIFIFAGLAFTVEFPDTYNPWSNHGLAQSHWDIVCFNEAIYFAIVTMTTVGFGDWSPITATGRILLVLVIILGIAVFTSKLSSLVFAFDQFSPFTGKFNDSHRHVIVCGHFSTAALRAFLDEFYHENHTGDELRVVVLTSQAPSAEMQNLQGVRPIKWLVGKGRDPVEIEDTLKRCGLLKDTCQAIFLLNSGSVTSHGDAMAKDSILIMWTEAVQKLLRRDRTKQAAKGKVKPKVKLLATVLLDESKIHAEMAGADVVVCASEVKVALMAHSNYCFGLAPLVCNLVRSSEAEGSSYTDGCDWEIYTVSVKRFAGLTFTDAVLKIYKETQGQFDDHDEHHHHTMENALEHLHLPHHHHKHRDMRKAGLLLIGIQHGSDGSQHLYEGGSRMGGGENVICNPGPEYVLAPDDKGILLAPDEAAAQELVVEDTNASQVSYASVEKHLVRSIQSTRKQHDLRGKEEGYEDDSTDKMGEDCVNRDVARFERAFVPKDLAGHVLICDSQAMHIGQLLSHIMGYRLHPKNISHIVLLTERQGAQWEQEWERMLLSLSRRYTGGSAIGTEQVTIIRGSALHIDDLERAGCRTASFAVVLGSDNSSNDKDSGSDNGSVLEDAETVKMFTLIRRMCPNAYTVVELKDSMNMVYCDPTDWWPTEGGDIGQAPIFAAGHVVSPQILETLLCQAFYNPGLPEALQCFFSGPSALLHAPVPQQFDGKPYGELMQWLVRKRGLVPVALYAASTSQAAKDVAENKLSTKEDVYSAALNLLQRSQNASEDDKDSGVDRILPCLLTNPSLDLLVRAPELGSSEATKEGDYVLVFPGNHNRGTHESVEKEAAKILAAAKPGDYSVARALRVTTMENKRKAAALQARIRRRAGAGSSGKQPMSPPLSLSQFLHEN